MIRRHGARWLVGVGLAAAALLFLSHPASAQTVSNGSCATGSCGPVSAVLHGHDCFHCQKFHCPPHYKHCQEGPPNLCFVRGCPKPVCDPCHSPNWGYFQTCWTPWPWPPNWAHCPVPPPASAVVPGYVLPGTLPTPADLAPRKKSGL